MRIWLVLFISIAANAETISVRAKDAKYTFTLSDTEFSFRSEQAFWKIDRRDCNRELVDQFWGDIIAHWKELPAIDGEAAKLPVVYFDQKARWLNNLQKESYRFFRVLPGRGLAFKFEESQKCSASK